MKGLKRDNPKRVALQAFSFGSVAFIPREGLVTVRDFDLSHFIALKGDGLYAGFYILELLSRLVPERQSEPLIFSAALKVLESLEEGDELEPSLRNFEMDLLHHLGFGLDFRRVAAGSIDTAKAIEPLNLYSYRPNEGFVLVPGEYAGESSLPRDLGQLLWGQEILAIAARDFNDLAVRRAAKKLLRDALAPILGDRPLTSRMMYPNSRMVVDGQEPNRS
jgi:DNA repair protein RecO (recombination protein O)|tara:strand:+ start:982 stop:1641 length:660 start_codon:yes stop_codon:yes gene_type:complete